MLLSKPILAAAIVGAFTIAPALAQSGSMAGDHAMGADAMGSPKAATYVCRSAGAGEKPSAMMGSTSLICKPVAIEMRMSDGKMHMMGNPKATPSRTPDTSGLTVQQLNDAYAKWLNDIFSVNVNSNGS